MDECHFKQEDGIVAEATIHQNDNNHKITGVGNGRLDAVSNAIKHYFGISYELAFYEEHSLTKDLLPVQLLTLVLSVIKRNTGESELMPTLLKHPSRLW